MSNRQYLSGDPRALMGAWQQICGQWQQIVGQAGPPGAGPLVNGPGATGVAHGPYGDPHGARYDHHRHGQAFGGIPPRAYLRDMPEPDMANRQVLPMNTGTTPVPIIMNSYLPMANK